MRVYISEGEIMTKSFNGLNIGGEWFDGYQVKDTQWDSEGICRRCGKAFTRKRRTQIFCSRDCVSKYRIRLKEMKQLYGKDFNHWLNSTVDYTYSPDKF